jgi:hypothetical protein
LKKFLLFFALLCAAQAYKDAFYLGYYGGIIDGSLEKGEAKHEFESDGALKGGRIGWNNNTRSHFLAKIRWEIFYEERFFKRENLEKIIAASPNLTAAEKDAISSRRRHSWHSGANVALGWNTDLFLTAELVPFVKMGFGLGKFDEELGHGSNMHLGVGAALALRYAEITVEARREFWQLKGFRLPFKAPFSGEGSIDHLSAGINIKF